MYGFEIIQDLAAVLSGNELIVSSNGNISRQVYHYLPQPQIYLRGSMGLPIPVGLGVAMARPEKQILTIVGDGNLLMGLGSLATTAFVRPSNLKILIIDNNEYATTGNQRTTSGILNYPSLLDGFDIPNIVPILRNDPIESVRGKFQIWLNSSELCVLPALVDTKPPTLSNIPLHPEEIAAFQRTCKE
ncbi:MAG: Sulfopyruvate decarboxylase subunit beta [Candidatus Thorarchaeota archaeon AB_25]|nr:MAG: Sulfopyruvate decarboxylase subunit beta [Candidatus Thorarchaeota archaeon AB_25]